MLNFGSDFLPTFIARAIVLLIAFTIHELSHAVTADYMGDSTARRLGRVTLNPLAHLDPIGTIMLLVAGFGWAKPVPVNPYNLRGNPRTGMAVVAAAGPVSNLMLASLAIVPLRLGWINAVPFNTGSVFPDASFLLFEFVWINLILAFFNLIPVAPLDGSKILLGLLPSQAAYNLRPLEQYGPLLLLVLIFLLPQLGVDVLQPLVVRPSLWLFNIMLGA